VTRPLFYCFAAGVGQMSSADNTGGICGFRPSAAGRIPAADFAPARTARTARTAHEL
jgi:hypothetical protein